MGTGGSRVAVDSRGKVRRLRLSGEDRQASHSEDDCQSTGMQAEEFLTISNPWSGSGWRLAAGGRIGDEFFPPLGAKKDIPVV